MGEVRRSKRKPPKGERCDMMAVGDTRRAAPILVRCSNPATVELLGYAPVGETWVCEPCARKLLARGGERGEPGFHHGEACWAKTGPRPGDDLPKHQGGPDYDLAHAWLRWAIANYPSPAGAVEDLADLISTLRGGELGEP